MIQKGIVTGKLNHCGYGDIPFSGDIKGCWGL